MKTVLKLDYHLENVTRLICNYSSSRSGQSGQARCIRAREIPKENFSQLWLFPPKISLGQ